MGKTIETGSWALEVTRGLDVGRVFPIGGAGDVLLGNAPEAPGSINLSDQEGSSPRRMAPRHATLIQSQGNLSVRDLESPTGTFVNRQRVLPGQARGLQVGDVIQMGAVHLRVITANKSSPAPVSVPVAIPGSTPRSPTFSFSFVLAGGGTCRTWDDFLAVSSQRWEGMRDELASGRLSAFLVAIGRPSLVPSPGPVQDLDERLDAWLAGLPTTRPAVPELDVHPSRVVIKVTPGGGMVRRSVRVANVGYRLLRATARVEPPGCPWLSLPSEFAARPFVTVEGLDLPVEVAVPDKLPVPLSAELVVEGNGGTKRVVVVLEAKPASGDLPTDPGEAGLPGSGGLTLGELIGRQRSSLRLSSWPLIFLAARILIGVASGSIGADAMKASGPDNPPLSRVAGVLGVIGVLVGGWLAIVRGGRSEGLTGAFAGGAAGMIVAAGLVAACRAVEPVLGPWSSSVVAVGLLWTLLGMGLAVVSVVMIKEKP